jgi:hypothetical protein
MKKKTKLKKKITKAHNRFIQKVVLLKVEAGKLELWRTMHSFNDVTKSYVKDLTE